MKRSPFKKKNGLKRTAFKSSAPTYKKREPSVKEKEWTDIRNELKERFAKVGIVSCELKYEGCIKSFNFGFGWTFAHSLKRVDITPAKIDADKRAREMREVIYACTHCHSVIEQLGNKENKMYDIVVNIIHSRKKQP